MAKDYFCDQSTKKLFTYNQLASFEQLWQLETEWFEEPNYRRNGWSGVVRYALHDEDGQINYVFIKRQENHNHKTLLHPIKGIPTFRREFINIRRLNKHNIPNLTTLYYGERTVNGNRQAILVTRSLEGYQSFEKYCSATETRESQLRSDIMQQGGIVIRRLHNAHFRHNCLYPKHLFVNTENGKVDVRLIDLEKLKWLPFTFQVRRNDLSRLIRRSNPMTRTDVLALIHSYLNYGENLSNSKLNEKLKKIITKHLNKN